MQWGQEIESVDLNGDTDWGRFDGASGRGDGHDVGRREVGSGQGTEWLVRSGLARGKRAIILGDIGTKGRV